MIAYLTGGIVTEAYWIQGPFSGTTDTWTNGSITNNYFDVSGEFGIGYMTLPIVIQRCIQGELAS